MSDQSPAPLSSPPIPPAHQSFPVPRPGTSRRPVRPAPIIVALTVLVLVLSGGWAASAWPEQPALGPAADFASPDPQAAWLPDYVPDSVRYPQAWTSMNRALRAKDRDAFLSYAEGQARTQLALWWDNTALIGRGTAYIVPAVGSDGGEGAFLGAELAFSSRPLRGSGDKDAGYRLTAGFSYDIVTTGEGDAMRITSFEPQTPMPWDEGPLHVAKRDHVVLYGMADEKTLVDATVDTAERAAVLAIRTITDLGGAVPMSGFVSGITDHQDRMDRWRFGDDVPAGDPQISGYATATTRPVGRSDLFEADIAVGDATSGVLVMMGPLSADQRLATFTHEFAHGLHYAAAPLTSFDDPPVAVYEGFATYIELRTGLTDVGWLRDRRVRDLIASKGAAALSDTAFDGDDAWLSYVAAGSYYLFAAENGGDPWQLALDGARSWDRSLIQVMNDPRFSEAAWQAWLASR
ncbi:hypothetical protein Q9R19_09060 [Microbacterium sp. ARD32]|uniref:hypothetical protein n=1 Tax=Microbacterium sp. ARD32 TaxID=2962577 RepID=UPI002881A450|nr:hypothetical protein [Microbacterium sp. ARD32]MDT0157772.1 hypothetical protein [Microbacterium sp. ARD32]